MKYYNPSNNFRAPIPREPKPYTPPQRKKTEVVIPRAPGDGAAHAEQLQPEKAAEQKPCREMECDKPAVFKPNQDDILLLGLILVLLANNCDDYLLLIILGYLLLSGKKAG